MMHVKSTILLLVLAMAGVAAMVYTMHRDGKSVAAVAASGRLLTAAQIPVDELTRITITKPGSPVMVFERTGSNWNQVQPFAYPMDPFSIRQIAVAARELELADTIDPATLGAKGNGQTLTTLSLDPAAAEVVYEWPKGKTTIQLGRQSVAGRAYLRVAGKPAVQVVSQGLHERVLQMDPKEWRDRTLFHDAGIESQRIEWLRDALKMTIVRDRKTWKMLEPAVTRVDPVGRDACMQDLGRAQAAGFILDQPTPDDLSKFGLVEPAATLAVTNADGVQKLLVGSRIGAAAGDRFAMIEGRPVVVKLSGQVVTALFRQPQDLAAPTGSGVIPADVKALVIRSTGPEGSQELGLERNLDKWQATSHGNTAVDAASVRELLDQLTQLRAPAVTFGEYPRELEIATVTLYGFDAKAIDTVRIVQEKGGAEGAAGKIALENGDNVLRVMPPGIKMRLTPKAFGLP